MLAEWKTDEFGNRTWEHEGWTIKVWSGSRSEPDLEGPDGEDADVDLERGTLTIRHEVVSGGHYGSRVTESVTVPIVVLIEYLKACKEST